MTISLTKKLLLICQYEPCSLIFTPRRPNKKQKHCSRKCASASQRIVLPSRVCEYALCDAVFVPSHNRPDKRFCGTEHAKAHRRQPPQPCAYAECGKIFVPPKRGQPYCSKDCASNGRRMPRPKGICEGCGCEYEIIHPVTRARRLRFCSSECAAKRRVPEVNCPTCGVRFRPKGGRKRRRKFCSIPCGAKGRKPSIPDRQPEQPPTPKRRAAPGKRKPKPPKPKPPRYVVDLVKQPKRTPWRPWEQPTRYVPDEPPKRKGSRVDQPSVTYVNTGTSPWASQAAQQTVLRYATDVADARELLAILGLDHDFGAESDSEPPRGRGHAEAVNGARGRAEAPQRRNSGDLVQHR